MTQPKTYNGKFNRVKNLMEQSHDVYFAVEAFAKANPDQDVFYRLSRLVYLEIKEELQRSGLTPKGEKTNGKSSKSAANMAFTLTGWLQTELFPETRIDSWMYDQKLFRAQNIGISIIDYYLSQKDDPHQSLKFSDGDIREKLEIDMRSRQEKQDAIIKRVYAS